MCFVVFTISAILVSFLSRKLGSNKHGKPFPFFLGSGGSIIVPFSCNGAFHLIVWHWSIVRILCFPGAPNAFYRHKNITSGFTGGGGNGSNVCVCAEMAILSPEAARQMPLGGRGCPQYP